MEYIIEFLDNKIFTSIYDFYLLFLLFSTLFFLTLGLFFIKNFFKKILFLLLNLILLFLNILISSNIPGTAKNFEYILSKFSEYEYINHFVTNDKKNIYFVLKHPNSENYFFFVKEYDEKESKKLREEIDSVKAVSRMDQGETKKLRVEIRRNGFRSFETKFESYDIKVPVLPPKE